MTVTPVHDRVIVKPDPPQETYGALQVPGSLVEKPKKGTVMAVGAGNPDSLKPMTVKVGDIVLFSKYANTEIEIENETYLVMPEKDILVIL